MRTVIVILYGMSIGLLAHTLTNYGIENWQLSSQQTLVWCLFSIIFLGGMYESI